MQAVAIVSIAAAVATILVLAGYLIFLAVILRRVNARLRALTGTLGEVAAGTDPIGATVEAIEIQLRRVRAALGRFTGDHPPPSHPPPSHPPPSHPPPPSRANGGRQ
jgi:hypothetical protein